MSAGGRQEAWRWRETSYYTRQHSISVIEAKDKPERKQPFGFSRELEPESAPDRHSEPQLWEGDGA